MSRFQPVMNRQEPVGWFEQALHYGQKIPGKLGYVCYRKLKRRYRFRNSHVWKEMVDDLRKGDLCIDLGANVGTVTMQLAQTGADVIAFEPDPMTFEWMTTSIGIGKNITLVQKAAGHKEDRLLLKRSTRLDEDFERFSECASLVRSDSGVNQDNAVEVEVVDLPAFLESLNRDIRLIKMDIEGSEWDLLEVLLDHPVLERIDCIFVETHEWMDPKLYMAKAARLQEKAETLDRPYINLFWH